MCVCESRRQAHKFAATIVAVAAATAMKAQPGLKRMLSLRLWARQCINKKGLRSMCEKVEFAYFH